MHNAKDFQLDQHDVEPPARLRPGPPNLTETRLVLHAAAQDELSEPRRAATGKIGLRASAGGFTTPPFDNARRIWVEGTEIKTAAAAERISARQISGADPEAAQFVADWFAFGASVLLHLREDFDDRTEISMIQLWPEHFDIAVEIGSEAAGERATYGFSPGDEQHPEPYVYVSPWKAQTPGPLWKATGFAGAELGYSDLLAAPDPAAVALFFLRTRVKAVRN